MPRGRTKSTTPKKNVVVPTTTTSTTSIVDDDVVDMNVLQERKLQIIQRLNDISIGTTTTTAAISMEEVVSSSTVQPVAVVSSSVTEITATNIPTTTTTTTTKKKKRGRKSNIIPDDDIPSTLAILPTTSTFAAAAVTTDSTISLGSSSSSTTTVVIQRYDKTIDVHWDYLLKEMKWLSTDFGSERKRHYSTCKKMASSAFIYYNNRTIREQKIIQDAIQKQKKLANKISRECIIKKFWLPIQRVITYKQKVSYDTVRYTIMNQQLVQLIHQTEQYTNLLRQDSNHHHHMTTDDSTGSQYDHLISIEQALVKGKVFHSSSNSTIIRQPQQRKAKQRITDYKRLLQRIDSGTTITSENDTNNTDHHHYHSNILYGESTDDNNSGSDATYDPNSDSDVQNELGEVNDDESTLRAAELEEWQERYNIINNNNIGSTTDITDISFVADPMELQKLYEEADMDIHDVIERMRIEGVDINNEEPDNKSSVTTTRDVDAAVSSLLDTTVVATTEHSQQQRHVQFMDDTIQYDTSHPVISLESSSTNQSTPLPISIDNSNGTTSGGSNFNVANQDGNDGDDDMDASDVDDYNDTNNDNDQNVDDDDDEFVVDMAVEEVDDETTMEQEELLPQDISADDEIRLLQQENELSIDELRKLYYNNNNNNHSDDTAAHDEVTRTTSNTKDEVVVDDDVYEQDVTISKYDENNRIDSDVNIASTTRLLQPTNEDLMGNDNINDDDEEEEFVPDENIVDDETTMEAEERLGRDISYEEEISMLKRESEMSIDELRAMYEKMSNETFQNNVMDDTGVTDDEAVKVTTELKESVVVDPTDNNKDTEEVKNVDEVIPECSNNNIPSTKRARVEMEVDNENPATNNNHLITTPMIVSRPFLIPSRVKLREYQHMGLSWLVSLQSRRLNGILADEMGLGKTLQTISLLAYLAAYKGIWGPHLIVVPTSVILNWETELKRFCPALKVLCYYGSAKRRKELRAGWTKSNWYHVIVTSYQLVVQDSFAFKRKRWYYLVLDEAQHIKNFQSQRWQTLISFNTQRRLLLTGTPLQNNLMELWSLLHFLMPYIFRSRKEFSYWFANPMNNMIEGVSDKGEDVVHRLHEIIRPFVLRRLKKDVETQMPGKFEHIIKCQLSRRQMFIYEEFMARSSTRQALSQGANFMGMMNVLMQLRKVCNHPDLFEPRSVITPFVIEPIVYPMAADVVGLTSTYSPFSTVSAGFLCPLWCGSGAVPSIDAASKHGIVQSDALLALEASLDGNLVQDEGYGSEGILVPAQIKTMFDDIIKNETKLRQENIRFLNEINSRRCQATHFPYSRSFVQAVLIPEPPLQRYKTDILSSPAYLLAIRKDLYERADNVSELLKRFVFAVPKAGASPIVMSTKAAATDSLKNATIYNDLALSLQECLRPFREAHSRLTTFFPDKKLVQFDAGKLQALAQLLRERKHGGHKVLIFTQMSKMLDILESFLNLNGHTYVRLDGGTSIEQRQRLMDRFNNDPKIFCFILSTRSGGTGVNLTGADTVVFYDSDWNPAQDAQAQDRAHRIGQTREVHIFRLVTEHTIEENILKKAKQKRNLDVLVMDKGNFDATLLKRKRIKSEDTTHESNHTGDLYTKGGLREILGVGIVPLNDKQSLDEERVVTSEQLERTMTSLEDVDDANALKGSRKEAEEELKEFDETIEYKKDSDADDDEETKLESVIEHEKVDPKNEEKELENEIAAWQEKVGVDPAVIEASLSPVERYGLRFCEVVDPYYSLFAVLEYRQKLETRASPDELDIAQIEKDKALEEARAFEEGDLLFTNPTPDDLIRQINLYRREKARLISNRKRRKLMGEDWEQKLDAKTQYPFWYNIDTGESTWEKPKVIIEIESYNLAYEQKWRLLPTKPLIRIMTFLNTYPDRMRSSEVCNEWRKAATDASFVRHVYPVEMGAYTRDDAKMEFNHYRTIEDAIKSALPGDTIELADGHYWQNSDLVVGKPLRIIGDDKNPFNVTIEMSGTLVWSVHGGFIEGVTFRRPKISSEKMQNRDLLHLDQTAMLKMNSVVLDNDGNNGNVVTLLGPDSKGFWESVLIRNGSVGLLLNNGSTMKLYQSIISNNSKSGIVCDDESEILLNGSNIERNGEFGISLKGHSSALVQNSNVVHNAVLPISKESGCTIISVGNFCTKTDLTNEAPPGFQFVH